MVLLGLPAQNTPTNIHERIVAIEILFSQNRKKDLAAWLGYEKAIFMILLGLPAPKKPTNKHEGNRGYRNLILPK